ncbi:E3 ubiquitin-protein ligase rnf152 [Solea solea]|uniref:E3 ubiquitin-protein ligase rnf152 n=1 Tax=Solea solea TaxID=90069 RepID=UPI00272B0215|nr:E3 ubiquitin-protein ligase rnf152 [Solea solea]
MNPYGDTDQDSHPRNDDDDAASLPCSDLGLDNDTHSPSFSSSPCPPVILTGHTSSPSTPHLAPTTTLTSSQVSVIIPSPELQQSPLPPQFLEDTCPDLECSICFSEFNNVFRCPKMLHCKHTFCLECLARINVKSAEPSNILCPLCRGLTPLPTLGLPRLPTDSDVLSYLPAAMQRVYSIRFLRKKGKLEVKRSSGSHQQWGQMTQRSANPSLNVGLPSPPVEGHSGAGGLGGALFRLTGQPVCRAFLLTSVVMMMLLLTGIVIFLLTYKNENDPQ